MNSSPKTNDALILIKKLMTSTGRYVKKNIPSSKYADLYLDVMSRCLPSKTDTILSLKEKINRQLVLGNLLYPSRVRNFFSKKSYYHHLACQHAMDIVDSIDLRFAEGSLHPEYKYLHEIGEEIDDYKSFL